MQGQIVCGGDEAQAIDQSHRRQIGACPKVVWYFVEAVDLEIALGRKLLEQIAWCGQIVPFPGAPSREFFASLVRQFADFVVLRLDDRSQAVGCPLGSKVNDRPYLTHANVVDGGDL